MSCRLSVVLVSDYGGGAREEREILEVLTALASQDYPGVVEFLLVHERDNPAFHCALAGLRVLRSAAASSYRRKNTA